MTLNLKNIFAVGDGLYTYTRVGVLDGRTVSPPLVIQSH